ncbi:MAG: nucleotidyl transferase AbiEii/AbiGii toxin family protein [Pseudonocardiaceae bacterium]
MGADRKFPYTHAAAFRAALKARFTAIAKQDSRYTVNELQRQFAYDRILARRFSAEDGERWVLKGAGALLARLSVARHSKDIDLYYAGLSAAPEQATAALVAAADRDISDYIPVRGKQDHGSSGGCEGKAGAPVRLPWRALRELPCRHCGRYSDERPARLGAPADPTTDRRSVRPDYRAFPLPDHCADKLCAIMETHEQIGGTRVSSRVKDLVDLALIARSHTIDGAALRVAILAGTGHRGRTLPAAFAVPDWEIWRAGFPRTMAAAPGEPMIFTDALNLVKRFLDPVLSGPISGRRDPRAGCGSFHHADRIWRDRAGWSVSFSAANHLFAQFRAFWSAGKCSRPLRERNVARSVARWHS